MMRPRSRRPTSASPWASPVRTCPRKPPTWCYRRQLRQHRQGGRRGPRRLRQHSEISDLPLSTNSGELLTMFAGVMFAGMARPGLGGPRAIPPPPRRANSCGSIWSPMDPLRWRSASTQRSRGHEPGAPATRFRRAPEGRLGSPRMRRRSDDGRNARGPRRLLSGGMFTMFATGYGPNAFDEAHARTMAFTTLMMYPAVRRLSIAVHAGEVPSTAASKTSGCGRDRLRAGHPLLVIYVPCAAGGVSHGGAVRGGLDGGTGVSASLLVAMEIAKIGLRARDARLAAPANSRGCRGGRIAVPRLKRDAVDS